jgi:hypothetical protein
MQNGPRSTSTSFSLISKKRLQRASIRHVCVCVCVRVRRKRDRERARERESTLPLANFFFFASGRREAGLTCGAQLPAYSRCHIGSLRCITPPSLPPSVAFFLLHSVSRFLPLPLSFSLCHSLSLSVTVSLSVSLLCLPPLPPPFPPSLPPSLTPLPLSSLSLSPPLSSLRASILSIENVFVWGMCVCALVGGGWVGEWVCRADSRQRSPLN